MEKYKIIPNPHRWSASNAFSGNTKYKNVEKVVAVSGRMGELEGAKVAIMVLNFTFLEIKAVNY